MGRVPESAIEDRFGFHGEPKVPGEYGTGDQGLRLPVRLHYSVGKQRGGQGDNSVHDIAARTTEGNALLQQTLR